MSSQLTILLLKKRLFYPIQSNRLYFMVSFKRQLCFRKQDCKNRECPFNYLGKPQFFYEVVWNWVAFKLVQVLQKYGLNPMFKTNLKKWSKDMNCVVQFLKKKTQEDDEKKRAQVCIAILF